MCSEISAVYVSNDEHNDDCLKFTNKIKHAFYNIAREFVYVGFLLAECDYYETYKEWGYSSIHEYALDRLGLKKSSTYNFINVCKAFTEPTECMPCSYFMKDKYENFNYSQLVEMLSMSDKQRSQVTPDMSVKQIREVKKASVDEPNISTLFNLQLYRQIFSRSYHYKIDGKKCVFTISGQNVEISDIYPEGYMLSIDVTYRSSGSGCGKGRFLDYEEFKEFVLFYFYHYDESYNSRRLESVPEEAPAPDAPEEASAPEQEIIKNSFCDLTELAIGELCDLFDEIEEAALSPSGIDYRLCEIAIRIIQENGYVIYKKTK